MSETKSIVDDAFKQVAREAVRHVIQEHVGWGVESEIKDAIKELAADLARNDPEVRKMIRDRMIYWIGQQ